MIPDMVIRLGIDLIERGMVPDRITRAAIRRLCRSRLDDERGKSAHSIETSLEQFVRDMGDGPVAPVPETANEQHYELPPAFFDLVLGEHRKYSGCYWNPETRTLDHAEAEALRISCEHADLRDGQAVLELGCGWGSLTLWIATQYPNSHITAVSNSHSQRAFIEHAAKERGLSKVRVITNDMNDFDIDEQFDRIVSIEMFEHMRNYAELLRRCARWLRDDGLMFIHIFCHRAFAYTFETEDDRDWMGRHFFTGGIMPSHDLLTRFTEDMKVTERWWWNGTHYENTANAWLRNMDDHRDRIIPILEDVYGQADAKRWFNRWRVFFMACAELFGFARGEEWGVGHYRLQPARVMSPQGTGDVEAHPVEVATR